MKKLLVLLGITLCCGAASLSAQNSSGTERARTPAVQAKTRSHAVSALPSDRKHCVYYITTVNVTGSHIPITVCRFQGTNTPMYQSAHGSGYGVGDIGATGALSVSGALHTLDPAFAGH